jgi:hypothetical protein
MHRTPKHSLLQHKQGPKTGQPSSLKPTAAPQPTDASRPLIQTTSLRRPLAIRSTKQCMPSCSCTTHPICNPATPASLKHTALQYKPQEWQLRAGNLLAVRGSTSRACNHSRACISSRESVTTAASTAGFATPSAFLQTPHAGSQHLLASSAAAQNNKRGNHQLPSSTIPPLRCAVLCFSC